MFAQRLLYSALLAAALGLAPAATGSEPAGRKAAPMTWEDARVALRAAGAMIAKQQFKPADGYLCYYQKRLGAPYRKMISDARKRIAALARKSKSLDDYHLKGRQAALCMQLGAYRPALKLGREIRKLRPADSAGYAGHLGWCLLELGRIKEARREEKSHPASVDAKQLKLAGRLDSGGAPVSVLIEYVRGHYLRDRGDRLGALDRLSVALRKFHRGKARLEIYAEMFKQFRELSDPRGLRSCEERLLADFAGDSAARSVVHMARGQRAAKKKNYDRAVAALAEVMSAERREPDAGTPARAFMNRLHRAAMLASECSEKNGDLKRAHDYAIAARDHYKPWKQTGAKAAIALRRLNTRIRELAARRDQAGATTPPSP
jgi:hypothetical protein